MIDRKKQHGVVALTPSNQKRNFRNGGKWNAKFLKWEMKSSPQHAQFKSRDVFRPIAREQKGLMD